MTTEEKFRAAVNVIRSLPKNGSYQPSHDLMLRFYAYFKQATEGPCHASRPAFWEVIRKMKWDAWNRLGNMPRDEAMNNYVEELKKIVETMSYTENVADFLGSLDSFYDSVPVEDLELLVGNVIERIRSQPGSPLSRSPIGSREASPHRVQGSLGHITSSLETSPTSSYSASPLPPEEDDDEDEFIDTVETESEHNKESGKPLMNGMTNGVMNGVTNGVIKGVLKKPLQSIHHVHMNGGTRKSTDELPMMNGHVNGLTNGHSNGHSNGYSNGYGNGYNNGTEDEEFMTSDRGRPRERGSPKMRPRHDEQLKNELSRLPTELQTRHDISEQIRDTILHLQRDLDRVTSRVRSLEVSALSSNVHFAAQARPRHPKWWPLTDISPSAFLLLAAWPFVAHGLIIWLQRRRALRH